MPSILSSSSSSRESSPKSTPSSSRESSPKSTPSLSRESLPKSIVFDTKTLDSFFFASTHIGTNTGSSGHNFLFKACDIGFPTVDAIDNIDFFANKPGDKFCKEIQATANVVSFLGIGIEKGGICGGLGWWGRPDNLERRSSSGRSSHDSCAAATYNSERLNYDKRKLKKMNDNNCSFVRFCNTRPRNEFDRI
ncbi:hypothetical protein H5410_021909 [Solanum commersonii]|uniref:Uncharacterized protein n=1 Tax=Solanum commersonii TaxID=4109 RepID=A0A9J5ZGL8_SOLCO|nr:hypothetical protein H5410_021909 [Solanum commersonii]